MTTRPTTHRCPRPARAARPGRAPRMLAAGVILVAGLLLAGCSGNDLAQKDAARTPAAGAEPTTASTSGSLRSTRCHSANLTGNITEGGGGAAGSVEPYLVLTNTGRLACTLQGWPGVSLVGGGNGTQIGAPATFDRSREQATVTLAPKGSAHAPMRLTQAGNYDTATCDPKQASGFRVYPPGEKDSLYVAAPGNTGCASTRVELLTVQAVQPGAA